MSKFRNLVRKASVVNKVTNPNMKPSGSKLLDFLTANNLIRSGRNTTMFNDTIIVHNEHGELYIIIKTLMEQIALCNLLFLFCREERMGSDLNRPQIPAAVQRKVHEILLYT